MQRRKDVSVLWIGAVLILLFSACSPGSSSEPENTLHILATTYPVYLFATAVTEGVDGIQVDRLIEQEVSCLHDYTLTVNDMKAIEKADILLLNGLGLEDFLTRALEQSSAKRIDCSAGLEPLPAAGHEGHNHAAEYDPHIWMSRQAAGVMVENIAQGLGELDSVHADTYAENAKRAGSLLAGSEPGAKKEKLAGKYLITFHDGFQYFAKESGLTLLKSIEEEEGSETSAAEIKEIVALIQGYGIPAIFTEKNGSTATAEAIARETGVKIYALDLVMSGDGTGIQPYLDAMAENDRTVMEALA